MFIIHCTRTDKMWAPTALLISCSLALLSVALGGSIPNVDSLPISRQCQKQPAGKVLVLGGGPTTIYQPYYLMTRGSDSSPLELYSSSSNHCNHCTLDISSTTGLYPYQTTPKLVYLLGYRVNEIRPVFSVDMSTCTTYDVSDKFQGVGHQKNFVIYYEDGFDRITTENNTQLRLSYDFKGKQIGQPRTFLYDAKIVHSLPTSLQSRSSNIIIGNRERAVTKAGVNKEFYNLIDADGRFIKNLITLKYIRIGPDIVFNVGNSVSTFCYGESDYECVQFDQAGNEVLRKPVTHDSEKLRKKVQRQLLSVHNLKDDPGFVLFTAFYYDLATEPRYPVKVIATEIRPDKTIQKSYLLANKNYHLIAVTDYDELSGRFTVRERVEHPTAICLNTFSLATKLE